MLAKGRNIIDDTTCVQNWENQTDLLKTGQHFKTRGTSEKSMAEKNGTKLKNHETSALKVAETYELK